MNEAPQQPAPAEKAQSPLALAKKNIVDVVAAKVNDLMTRGELQLPPDYSPGNALKAAWLILQASQTKTKEPVLSVCTPDSIGAALLAMVVQGLNPAKAQGYFIPYGRRLTFQKSYHGSMALVRRIYGQDTEINAECVYVGDEFEYKIEAGHKTIVKHIQKLENIDESKIVGAYCVVKFPATSSRRPHTEVMTKAQIQRAWEQGETKGDSPAHRKFGGEMSEKTVISRACKALINSSDDSYLLRAIRAQELEGEAVRLDAEIDAAGEAPTLDFDAPLPPVDDPEGPLAAAPAGGNTAPALPAGEPTISISITSMGGPEREELVLTPPPADLPRQALDGSPLPPAGEARPRSSRRPRPDYA